jgi:hypothetical protein
MLRRVSDVRWSWEMPASNRLRAALEQEGCRLASADFRNSLEGKPSGAFFLSRGVSG